MRSLQELLIVLAIAAIVIFSIAECSGACDDPDRSEQALRAQGFKDITFGKHGTFECGEGDNSALTFTATNPVGNRVSGVVCCGFTKACTVRF